MEFVTYEQDGYVGIITINRPKALNALNSAVLEELDATFKAVDLDTTRCLILTGAGEKSFVAGADIGEMSTLTECNIRSARGWSWNHTWFWRNTETCTSCRCRHG